MSCNVIIRNAAILSASSGIPGAFLPGIDVAAITGIWTKMTIDLAKETGRHMDNDTVGKFVLAIAQGVGLYIGGGKLFTMLLHLIPGVGTLAVVTINAALNFIYTMRFGRLLAKEFEKSGFDKESLKQMATGMLAILCVVPTLSEFRDAFSIINNNHT